MAWNDKFDELGGNEDASIKDQKVVLPQEIEEKEDEIDCQADEQVLAPLRLRKPQVEPAPRGEPSSRIVESTPEDGENVPWMVGRLQIKGKSTFWNTPPGGELPVIQQG